MTNNFTVIQHSYSVFVAVLTVNWEFFADIAAASFDGFLVTSVVWSLVVIVYAFLFVAIAGVIIAMWILYHTPSVY